MIYIINLIILIFVNNAKIILPIRLHILDSAAQMLKLLEILIPFCFRSLLSSAATSVVEAGASVS